MEQVLALAVEPDCLIGHQASALGRTDLDAEVGLARGAKEAFLAFRSVERDHVVAGNNGGDACADGFDDSAAFVAEDDGEDAFGVVAVQRVGVGVATEQSEVLIIPK